MSTVQAKFPKHNSATIQYRLWKFYMIWFINTESHTKISSVNSGELGGERSIWKPKID